MRYRTPVVRPTFVGRERSLQHLQRAAVSWVASEALADLVALQGQVMPTSSVSDNLEWLSAFSAAHWDFRNGRERLAIEATDDLPSSLVLDAALALGLRGASTPAKDEYTHVLILGGLVSACYQRAHFAHQLLSSGIRAGQVTALCGDRTLHVSERATVAAAGLTSLDNEADALNAALRDAFAATPEQSPILLLAPSADPRRRRANTVDTYRWWGREMVDLSESDSVLVITTDIYVPYQTCDAIRVLGLESGCEIDVVGVDRVNAGGPIRGRSWSNAHYLQEIRSMILSIECLLAELDTARMG